MGPMEPFQKGFGEIGTASTSIGSRRHEKGKILMNELRFKLVAFLSDGLNNVTYPPTEYACMTSVDVGEITGKISVQEVLWFKILFFSYLNFVLVKYYWQTKIYFVFD